MKLSNTYRSFSIFIMVLFLLMCAGEKTMAQSSPNFTMTRNVIDAAGRPSKSTNFQLVDACGQTSPLGSQISTNYRLEPGFFGMAVHNSPTTLATRGDLEVPENYELFPAYPNPFNPQTTIKYQLPSTGDVKLTVFNLQGQEIQRIETGSQTAGIYSVVWDGCNQYGQSVASGMYLYRLEVTSENQQSFIMTRKMLLMK